MPIPYNFPGTAEALIQDEAVGTVFERYAELFVDAAGDEEAEQELLGDSTGQLRRELEEELLACRTHISVESFAIAREIYGPQVGLSDLMRQPLISDEAKERTVGWFATQLFEQYKVHERAQMVLRGAIDLNETGTESS